MVYKFIQTSKKFEKNVLDYTSVVHTMCKEKNMKTKGLLFPQTIIIFNHIINLLISIIFI